MGAILEYIEGKLVIHLAKCINYGERKSQQQET